MREVFRNFDSTCFGLEVPEVIEGGGGNPSEQGGIKGGSVFYWEDGGRNW